MCTAPPGYREQLCGDAGQAIVQMARSKHNSLEYAIKFFALRSAFDAEAALYRDRRNPLGQFLPKVRPSAPLCPLPSIKTNKT